MKAIKFWSFLCFLCVGIAFSSCDNDGEDVDSGDSPVEEYVNSDGVASGLELYGIYEAYSSAGSSTASIITMTPGLVGVYTDYTENKEIPGWKTGFVTGVAMGKFGLEDEAQVTKDMYNEVAGIVSIFDEGITVDTAIEAMVSIQTLLNK